MRYQNSKWNYMWLRNQICFDLCLEIAKTTHFVRIRIKLRLLHFRSSWTTLWFSLLLLLLDKVICFIKYIMKPKCQTCSKIQRLLLKWKCFRNEHTLFDVVICLGWGHIVFIIRKRIATRNKKERKRRPCPKAIW